MADLGHTVVAVDVDPAKVDALNAGKAPLFEPGLDELLARVLPTGRLRFTTDYAEVATARVHFLCVGTPQRRRGERRRHLLRLRRRRLAGPAPDLRRAGRGQVHGAGRHRRPAARAAAAGRAHRHAGPPGLEPRVPARGLRHRGHPGPGPVRVRRRRADRRGRHRPAGPGVRRTAGHRDAAPGHRLRHRRAGQGRRQRLPGHQDLVHQRHGRGLRGRRRATSSSSPTRSATTTGSGASSSTPASASAAAACPRTSARSWPAPASSAPTRP